jgi:RNA polymerase sigma factor (sigma-70 family)
VVGFPHTPMSDSYVDWMQVLARVEAGDRNALALLTRLITGLLRRQGAQDLHEHWADICSDVLTALVRAIRRDALRDEKAFVSYVAVITRRSLEPYIKSKVRARISSELDPETPAPASRSDDPQLRRDLEIGLASLTLSQRRVIETVYLQGFTAIEAASVLEMPIGSVKRLQFEGLRSIREAMLVPRRER